MGDGMRIPYNRFRQLVQLSQGLLYKRWRRKHRPLKPSLKLLPKLDTTAKAPDIDQMLAELNRNILYEIEPPDQSDQSDQKRDDGWIERALDDFRSL